MKVKLTSRVRETPKHGLGWEERDGEIINPKIGSVRHVVICDDSGKPLYDTIEIREQAGCVIIPYYLNSSGYYFGVIRQVRPILEDPETKEQGKVVSMQFPMGFVIKGESLEETVRRELAEETQSIAVTVEYLGSINPLTSFYAEQKANEVFAVKVDEDKVIKIKKENVSKEAQKEGILSLDYIPQGELFDKIRLGKMFCGLSLAALVKFIALYPTILI